MSVRDLLAAAAREQVALVALSAPAPAAMAGFARAARDAQAPLLLVRPSGQGEEKGPEEGRDDSAFAEAAFAAADGLRFRGPFALLKDPPRALGAVPDRERVQREIEAGFTGLSLAAADTQQSARDAALAATPVCQLELGLEIVPLGGARAAAELARQLRSRGAAPSAVRITGMEDEAAALGEGLRGIALSTATESLADGLARRGMRQLVASGPFLRALRRAAPRQIWETLEAWADETGATLEQSAARHQRLLRDLPAPAQARLEALCCFEALDLFRTAGAQGTSTRVVSAVAALHEGEE
ncbi:MAG TPA: hypothetical protein VFL36_21155 [Myxococcales bacterium]|nr:hypothetical protein [Myxococcales bacterium]